MAASRDIYYGPGFANTSTVSAINISATVTTETSAVIFVHTHEHKSSRGILSRDLEVQSVHDIFIIFYIITHISPSLDDDGNDDNDGTSSEE